ncbi:G-alpha-domain-containing protein [Wolfiporia cocos MD-104 SS10]|uniref:G-alpha-domain-containing protein n=1 Tax=Wolfiporia cocos (strain MD-104) TaxID=742152 RepID=A0A2H3JR52_WOLCO|nr:G-alpha-domain-containing protein [Wolfiporia cocos MD-104 SS10]
MAKFQSRSKFLPAALDDPLAAAIAPPADETEAERAARLQKETEAKRISDDIDEGIRQERDAWKRNKALFKLLLLGQSESGKSTTLKNFQLTFAPKAWQEERASWRAVIQLNLVRSVNIVLDALADELAVQPAARPQSSPSPASTASDGPSPPPSPSEDGPAPPSGAEHERARQPAPAELTSKHTLLKLRLAPLRHVERELKVRLGAATCEVSADGADAQGVMHATPFDAAYARSARGNDLCLRSNRSWREALGGSGEVGSGHERSLEDDATEVIAGCRDDIAALWADDAVRAMLRRRKIRIEESPGFFLDESERITTREYEPSDEDVVRTRLRTVGVQEYRLKFETGNMDRAIAKEWIMYDVGGSRTSRAAWLPYFEDANAILFLAPVSCFDELLAEDRRVNRLEDSFILWKSIVQSKLLAKCIIVLFLNKYDLLAKKLKAGVKINKYLSSFGDRDNNAPTFAKYLHHKFREQHKDLSPEHRSFYGYVTSVVDTKATASTLASVRDGLIQQYLQKADLV